jgi:hypothetical protein
MNSPGEQTKGNVEILFAQVSRFLYFHYQINVQMLGMLVHKSVLNTTWLLLYFYAGTIKCRWPASDPTKRNL